MTELLILWFFSGLTFAMQMAYRFPLVNPFPAEISPSTWRLVKVFCYCVVIILGPLAALVDIAYGQMTRGKE